MIVITIGIRETVGSCKTIISLSNARRSKIKTIDTHIDARGGEGRTPPSKGQICVISAFSDLSLLLERMKKKQKKTNRTTYTRNSIYNI